MAVSLTGCGASPYPVLNALCVIDCDGKIKASREAGERDASAEATRSAYQGLVNAALTTPMAPLFARARRNRDTDGLIFGLALLAGRDTRLIEDAEYLQHDEWHHSDYWLRKPRPDGVNTQTTAIYVPSAVRGGAGTTQLVQVQSRTSDDSYAMAIACIESLGEPEGMMELGAGLKTYACGGGENRNRLRAVLRENP